MSGLIINRLVFPKNKEQEQEKRKTTIERNWKRRRRRRHFSSRCFLFPPSSLLFPQDDFLFLSSSPSFLLVTNTCFRRRRRFHFCAWKALPAVSVIKKSEKVLQSLAKFCIFAYRGDRKTFFMKSHATSVGGNKTAQAIQYDWNDIAKWLIVPCKKTEIGD